jgi:hypothetical protein
MKDTPASRSYGPTLRRHLAALHQTLDVERDFLLILGLFLAFRVMAVLAFRPGGQIMDFSDFSDWYLGVGQLTRQGYVPYVNSWDPYPPLVNLLIIGLYHVSSWLPPWQFPNLWFSLLLGGTFSVFETGNLVLIYAMARRLTGRRGALRSAWFYSLLFVPVYTLTGWFESYPIFFFLLSTYLLMRGRPLWSALTSGIGFMIRLFPVILLPAGARVASLSCQADPACGGPPPRWCLRIPRLNLTLDLRRVALYLGIFAFPIVAIGLPLYVVNPHLVAGPLVLSNAREPWETVWALLAGRYEYGVTITDVRNVLWQPASSSSSSPFWMGLTAAFGLIYLFAYTRHIDWGNARHVAAFAGFTLTLFMLYSKGYSPQWLGWVLAFVAVLLPNLRGAFYALVTSVLNLVEANVFFIVVPDEQWLLIVTVGLRTLILVLLSAEFMLIARPDWLTPEIDRARRWALGGLAALILAGSLPAGIRFVNAYFDVRYQLSPYQSTIATLRSESRPGGVLLVNSYDNRTYDWLHPYLRDRLTFYMLDDYAPPGESVEARTTALLEQIARTRRDWWVFDNAPAARSPSGEVAARWLAANATLLSANDRDGGRLYHLAVR